MSESLLYREMHFSRLGGTLPERVGSFVIGISSKAIDAYRIEHPTHVTDAVFRNLITAKERKHTEEFGSILIGQLDKYLSQAEVQAAIRELGAFLEQQSDR